ncbi:MAG: terpene cyclase/mutase family protein [Planctomycetes bacterium]|nr:terpene cyclase/mutase family protein [Planctomycetota bacterium]
MTPLTSRRRAALAALLAGAVTVAAPAAPRVRAQDDDLVVDRPRHITPRTVQAIERGVRWLAQRQRRDGAWDEGGGMGSYPVAMTALAGMALLGHGDTPTRGKYAGNVRRAVTYLTDPRQASRTTGLITSRGTGEEGRSMYGHGFAMMFLAQALGDDGDPALQKRVIDVLHKGVELTGRAQSGRGGWLYTPDSGGDEGSVTVTQVQALRACRNAGMAVPVRIVRQAVGYIEASAQPDGGIAYQVGMTGSQPAITAAAVAVLYNAGQYDSPVARRCLEFCRQRIDVRAGGGGGFGHWFYTHLYLSQAYWQVGGQDWERYFPLVRDHLINTQGADGSWQGDGVGHVYGTAIAVTILTLPFEHVPLYMR